MAVVSISRIQVRRGRKLEGTGLPQLASGEFGWAVDTQELFIGNGSVAEGAPLVGNTQILTENSNILAFASSYEYKEPNDNIVTGPDSNNPVQRSIQERLDEIVTIKSFGAPGNGTDQTAEIQQAINQLFDNPGIAFDPAARMVLHIPAGTYALTDTITIPPNCYLKGAGKNRTVINKSTPGPAFKTVSNTNGNGSLPTNIIVENFSLNLVGASGFLLDSCTDSVFRNISINGDWTTSQGQKDNLYGFNLTSSLDVVQNNDFVDVEATNLGVAFFSEHDCLENRIYHCFLHNLYKAMSFGIQSGNISLSPVGPNKNLGFQKNTISQCFFKDISNHAVIVGRGNDNLFTGNKFSNVFSVVDSFGRQNPSGPVMQFFPNTKGNSSQADYFDRTEESLFSPDLNHPEPRVYVPEIAGPVFYENQYINRIELGKIDPGQVLLKLPCDVPQSFEIEYFYDLFDTNGLRAVRKGTLIITADPRDQRKDIIDDFVTTTSAGEDLVFRTVFLDQDNDAVQDSLGIEIENSIGTIENSILTFKIKTFR